MQTVTVAVATGGLFDDERTKSLAKKVMSLACITFVLFVISSIVSIFSPYNQAIINGDLDKFEDDFSDEQIEALETTGKASIIGGTIIGILCFGSVMFAGWYGAKYQERTYLGIFSGCSALCAFCSCLNFIYLFAAVGASGTLTCAQVEELGFDPGACNASIVFGAILTILYLLNTYYSYNLWQRAEVVIAYPVVQAQTTPVQVQKATPVDNVFPDQKF